MASCGVLPSDETLAHSVRDGDDRAFELLYDRYWTRICRYAARLLRSASDGEDAAQVAFANAYRALHAGQTPRAVRPWLYAITRNAAFGLRAQRGDVVELSPALEAREEAPAGEAAALTSAVARLPERQRAVFALRELRGATNRETADALGLRESQVEQLLFAGRARLAELLLFGDSVSCETVRAAANTDLGRNERRALKRHVHHCADCSDLVSGRLKLGARLLGPLEALRRLVELGMTASSPVKAGAATVVALAVSAPVVVPAVQSIDKPARRAGHVTTTVGPVVERVVATPAPAPVHVAVHPAPVRRIRESAPATPPKPVTPVVTQAPKPVPPAPAPVAPVTRAPQPEDARPVRVAPVTRVVATRPAARTATRPAAVQPPVRERAASPEPEPAPSAPAAEPQRVERTVVAVEPTPPADPVPVTPDPAPARTRSG